MCKHSAMQSAAECDLQLVSAYSHSAQCTEFILANPASHIGQEKTKYQASDYMRGKKLGCMLTCFVLVIVQTVTNHRSNCEYTHQFELKAGYVCIRHVTSIHPGLQMLNKDFFQLALSHFVRLYHHCRVTCMNLYCTVSRPRHTD